MDTLNNRAYFDQTDLQKMVDILRKSKPDGHISDYPGIIDLHEMMNLTDIQARTQLWENEKGNCVAFAIVDLWHNLWFDAIPGVLSTFLEDQIIGWGLECLRSHMATAKTNEVLTLDTNCLSDNLERIALLKRHGFLERPVRTVQMLRSLQEQIPAPNLPVAFVLRAVKGDEEVDELVELHRAAFESDEMTTEYRISMMQVPGYDPELDLLVVAPDGNLAAFCFCYVNPESGGKEGFTDPIGTRPRYRRNGLARSLLLEGLRLLKRRGVEYVRFNTTGDNIAMQKMAMSVGFSIEKTKLWFSKPTY